MQITPKFDENGILLNPEEIKIEKYKKKNSQIFNIDKPVTIQEKLQWLILYENNNKLKAKCADKILLHEYCLYVLKKDICVPIIKIYNNANEIQLEELPKKFVLKCNHGWNMNIVVNDKENIPTNYKNMLNTWKSQDFGLHGYQLHYSLIRPQIFAEEFLEDKNNKYLIDYKFWCFNGEPKFYTINSDNGHKNGTDIIYYDINTDQDMEVYNKSKDVVYFSKPSKFELMKEYARKLTKPFKFCRVDFYQVNDIVYLGELTFTPGACYMVYKNLDIAKKLGQLLEI